MFKKSTTARSLALHGRTIRRWVSSLLPKKNRKVRRSRALAVEAIEDRITPAAFPIDAQFTVGAVTSGEASPSSIAVVNTNGDFVAVWESVETDGSGLGVYAQRFNNDGSPLDVDPVRVNDTIKGDQSHPAIASNGLGQFVITWQSESATGGNPDIYYKTGNFTEVTDWLTSSETPVNTTADGSQSHPSIAMDGDDNFIVVWQSDQNVLGGSGIDIYSRRGSFGGAFLASEELVTNADGDQTQPTVAMNVIDGSGNGRMIIAWVGPGPVSSDGEPTNAIRGTFAGYDSSFAVTPIHSDFVIPTEVQKDQVEPDVAMAGDGSFVAVWQSEGGQGTGSDLFFQQFDSTGAAVGTEISPVNTTLKEPQRYPEVAMDSGGKFLVVWQSQGQDSRSWGIVGRAFNSSGVGGAEFLVNVNQQGPQTLPAVASNDSGRTIVAWNGPFVPTHGGTEGEEEGVEGEGGHQPSVFARIFSDTGTGSVPPGTDALNKNGYEFQIASVDASEDVPASAAALTDGSYMVVWQSFGEAEDLSGYGVYGQHIASDGTLLGSKFLINSTTLGYQSNPVVTALPEGGFVVAWQGEVRGALDTDPSQYDIFARMFTSDGSGGFNAGTEFQVNQTITGQQIKPSIASDATGSFVVVWQTDALTGDELGTEIYGRRFPAGFQPGDAAPAEFRVNDVTFGIIPPSTIAGEAQVSPVVAMNAAGQFAVAWVSDHNILSDSIDTEKSVYVRWFGATAVDATDAEPEILANYYVKDAQEHPELGIDANGNLVVAWQSINQEPGGTGVSWGVFARQFEVDGSGVLSPVQSEEFLVNQTVNQPQRFAGIGMRADGKFSIAWQSINQDGSSWGVFQRQYLPDGTPETDEQSVNTVTSGPQILPVFAANSTGNYGIFWSGTAADHVDGVAGRIYTEHASIGGTAFLDINADGILQAGEPALSGRTIYIDLNNNGVIDGSDPIQTTDATGRYEFADLPAGNYSVRSVLYGGQTLTGTTTANGTVAINLLAGDDQLDADVGHRLRMVSFPTQVTANLFTYATGSVNERRVVNVYRALLNTDPSVSELAYAANVLDGGYNPIDFATSIYRRSEQLQFQVTQIFQTLFSRNPTAVDSSFWIDKLYSGYMPEAMVAVLTNGPEYQGVHTSNAAYITGLYDDILGRVPTQQDIDYWTYRLNNGTFTRTSLAFAFATSQEVYTKTVQDVFMQYLHRRATQADIDNWVGILLGAASGKSVNNPTIPIGQASTARMVELLLASSEFEAKSTAALG